MPPPLQLMIKFQGGRQFTKSEIYYSSSSAGMEIKPLNEVEFEKLLEYDTSVFGFVCREFLQKCGSRFLSALHGLQQTKMELLGTLSFITV